MLKPDRPSVYQYHDYRVLMRDWILYCVKARKHRSMRSIAQAVGLSAAHLTMVQKGRRGISEDALLKLAGVLGANADETEYFRLLREMSDADEHSQRSEALRQLQRFAKYRHQNIKEVETYKYLNHWYHVAIRQLAKTKGFKLDADWIQERLIHRVHINEIRQALEFLQEGGYIQIEKNGKVTVPDRRLECDGGVYKVGLSQFHRQLLTVAAEAIDHVPREERQIVAEVFPMASKHFAELQQLITEFIQKTAKQYADGEHGDRVCGLSVLAYPLTKKPENSD